LPLVRGREVRTSLSRPVRTGTSERRLEVTEINVSTLVTLEGVIEDRDWIRRD